MATKLHVTLKKSLCSGPIRAIKPKCFAYFGINPPNPIAGGNIWGSCVGTRMDSFREVAGKALWCPYPLAPSSTWISIHEIHGNKTLFIVFGLALKCITPGKPSEDIPGEKQVVIPFPKNPGQVVIPFPKNPQGWWFCLQFAVKSQTETKQRSYNDPTIPRQRVQDGNRTKSC